MQSTQQFHRIQGVASDFSLRPVRPPEHPGIQEAAEALTGYAIGEMLTHDVVITTMRQWRKNVNWMREEENHCWLMGYYDLNSPPYGTRPPDWQVRRMEDLDADAQRRLSGEQTAEEGNGEESS